MRTENKFYVLTAVIFFQEYIQDGIDWRKVEFEDNQDCLSLFEKVLCLSMINCSTCTLYCSVWSTLLSYISLFSPLWLSLV